MYDPRTCFLHHPIQKFCLTKELNFIRPKNVLDKNFVKFPSNQASNMSIIFEELTKSLTVLEPYIIFRHTDRKENGHALFIKEISNTYHQSCVYAFYISTILCLPWCFLNLCLFRLTFSVA